MARVEPAAYTPDLAISPGETIAELLQEFEMSVFDLADVIGLSEDQCVDLIQGALPINAELAESLAKFSRMPAYVWLNLDANYRRTLKRLHAETLQSNHNAFAKLFPLADMTKYGWIAKSNRPEFQTAALFDFLEITSPEDFSTSPILAAHFRKSPAHTPSDYAMAAWLTQGRHEAAKMVVDSFNVDELRRRIKDLRGLTRRGPAEFAPRIQAICAACGVAVVFVPAPRQCTASGAAYRIEEKRVVQLSLRHKRNDHFWFSLFHELAHVIYHSNDTFVDDFKYASDPREVEADKFASDVLLPSDAYAAWRIKSPLTRAAVLAFADQMDIAPGIVVGRLQREQLIGFDRLPDLFLSLDFRN